MIQVCGERVLRENRMKRKRLRDQKKQEVIRKRGHQNMQNTVKGTPKRTRKDISKKTNI